MVTWATVVAVAPELANVPLAAQTAILAHVAEQLSATAWGTRLTAGQTYLAAHLGTVRGAPGFKTEIVSQHRRDTSGDLDSTAYGREFRRLLRTLPAARVAVAS